MTINARLQGELRISAPIGPGKGLQQKRVQEYLNVNGIRVGVDSDWGPATSRGLELFAPGAKKVDQALMDQLALPIVKTIAPAAVLAGQPLATAVVATAREHLAAHPVEIGGANAGPWVRVYMDGNEGPAWPWCAGFVTLVIRQAAEAAGLSVPEHLKRTYSCDVLGGAARKVHKLVIGTSIDVKPGSVFLVRGAKAGDWVHTGIVIGVDAQTFTTIEGNTNDEGSREGFEVCRRIRNRANLDVVLL